MGQRKQYVKYWEVEEGLNRFWGPSHPWYTPGMYLRYLKLETGLSDAKLAHDLSVDSGYEIERGTARLWRKKRV